MKYQKQVRKDKPQVSITMRENLTNFTKIKSTKELNFMVDKKQLREKLEGKLLKQQETSLKKKSLKQLVQEYYETVKKSPAVAKVKAELKAKTKGKVSESDLEKLISEKVRKAVLEMVNKMGQKKVREMEDEIDMDVAPTDQEEPVSDEFNDEDLDLGDENMEDEEIEDEEIEDEEIEDEEIEDDDLDFDINNEEVDLDFGDEETDDLGDEEVPGEDFDLGDEEEDEDIDLEDEEEISDEELDSEINSEEAPEEPELTEAQKKAIRMKRMKDKALRLAKKKVSEEETGDPVKGTDPSEGVDATLAGNEELFDAVPDIDATGLNMDNKTPPDSDLGTEDESTSPNTPTEETDADDWIEGDGSEAGIGMKDGGTVNARGTTENRKSKWAVKKTEERLNYRKLLAGEYFKRLDE